MFPDAAALALQFYEIRVVQAIMECYEPLGNVFQLIFVDPHAAVAIVGFEVVRKDALGIYEQGNTCAR
jgi:hypothetical protein